MLRFITDIRLNVSYIGWEDTDLKFSYDDTILRTAISNYKNTPHIIQLENCKMQDDILNVMLTKFITPNLKNIILKNCNAIDTKHLHNLIIDNNIQLSLLDIRNTQCDINLICNLIKRNQIKICKLGDYNSGIGLYSNICKGYKLNNIVDILELLYNAQLKSNTIIETTYLLPNEKVYLGAFIPKNEEEYKNKLESQSIINNIEFNNTKYKYIHTKKKYT